MKTTIYSSSEFQERPGFTAFQQFNLLITELTSTLNSMSQDINNLQVAVNDLKQAQYDLYMNQRRQTESARGY